MAISSCGSLIICNRSMAVSRVSLLICTILSILFSQSSCQSMSFAGLGQEFNTSAADLGSSVLALEDPTGSYFLSFNNEGQSAPPFYDLVIVLGGNQFVSSGDGSFKAVGIWRANAGVKNNCSLRLEEDGNLVLRDYNQTIYWQTSTANAGVVRMALRDTGNLVLLDATNSTVWQSFEHPSDTLVLGQRLTAGGSMLGQGPYSLGIYDTGLYLFYSNGGAQPLPYWQLYPDTNSSPPAAQLGVAEVTRDAVHMFALTNSSVLLGSIPLPAFVNASLNDSSWWLLQLGSNGLLDGFRANSSEQQTSFSLPSTVQLYPCAMPEFCKGPSNTSSPYYVCAPGSGSCSSCPLVLPPGRDFTDLDPSCAASSVLPYPNCSSREDIAAHRFLNLSGFTHFALAFNVSILSSTLEDCADVCLRNCSCKAAFYVTTTSSCPRVSEVSNLINASGRPDHLAFIKYQQQRLALEPPVPSPHPGPAPLPSGEIGATHHPTMAKIIGAVLGTTAALVMIVSFWHFWRRKSKGREAGDDDADDDEEVFLGTLPGLPPRFSFKELKACTNDFSRKLGAGGFGAVYEGVNPRDKLKPVAVKRLEIGVSTQGSRQFQAEIATIGSIQHVNLVRLHGFCMEGSHRLLVYELMSNGSLDAYIKNPHSAVSDHDQHHGPLPWRTRFGIALGTARGLAYLHDECRERIIHCDIKPENILLNHRLEPAISDFGLAKLMSREQSYAATTMRGTRGYLAPEWVRNAPITEKSDVYSYGMVLLELVSGRRLYDVGSSSR